MASETNVRPIRFSDDDDIDIALPTSKVMPAHELEPVPSTSKYVRIADKRKDNWIFLEEGQQNRAATMGKSFLKLLKHQLPFKQKIFFFKPKLYSIIF